MKLKLFPTGSCKRHIKKRVPSRQGCILSGWTNKVVRTVLPSASTVASNWAVTAILDPLSPSFPNRVVQGSRKEGRERPWDFKRLPIAWRTSRDTIEDWAPVSNMARTGTPSIRMSRYNRSHCSFCVLYCTYSRISTRFKK